MLNLKMKALSLSVLILLISQSALSQLLQDEAEFYGTAINLHEWNESNHTVDGYDWSMPNWLEPEPTSGLEHSRAINGVSADELLQSAGFRGNLKRRLDWNWKLLEPAEGQFDFQKLRDKIDEVSENGRFKIELRIYGAVQKYEIRRDNSVVPEEDYNNYERDVIIGIEQSAPEWLADKGLPTITGNVFTNFRLTYYNDFSDGYHNLYMKMLAAFSNSGIANDPRILNAYIHLGSQTRGEEGHGPALDSNNRAKYEERIEGWANAYGVDRNKLMITSNEGKDLQHAYSVGVGQRNGFVENYLMHVANPDLGTRVDSQGYMEIDENAPIIKNKLASGDENEEYFLTVHMLDRFGPFDTFKHRFFESSLRMLQMRRTAVWGQNTAAFINPALTEFVSLSLAKDVYTSADAWTYLRQNNLQLNNPNNVNVKNQMDVSARNPDGSLPVKNFERWLYQRDDGIDVKTIPVRQRGAGGKQLFRDSDFEFDYTARRTDSANGFNKIGLALDDRFAQGSGTDVAIKVTYQDNGTDQWYLEYNNTANEKAKKWVTQNNTGSMKTVTWILNDISFDASDMENDFYLIANTGDLTASFVRVVKLEESDQNANPVPTQPTQPTQPNPTNCQADGPQASVGVQDTSQPGVDDGAFIFNFEDQSGRTNIEFSLDGGQTYPFNYQDSLGSATITERSAGTRNVWVRWGNDDCPTNLSDHTISSPAGQSTWLDKYWRIENVSSTSWLQTQECSGDNGAAISQVSKDSDGNCTMYRFELIDEEFVRIINRATGRYMMPKACAEEANETVNIIQISPDQAPGWCPQWRLNRTERDGENVFRLQNRVTGHYMRVESCSHDADDSATLRQVGSDFDGDCTLWKFAPTGVSLGGNDNG